MGSGYLVNPLMLVINTLFDLYILLVLLRFLLQMLRGILQTSCHHTNC